MKIKSDFVTNSSSTSFILIASGDGSRVEFLRAAGISAKSPLAVYFNQLYDLVQRVKEPLREYLEARPDKRERISADLWTRIENAERAGHDVFMGRLHSDGDETESFFCQESFIIAGETLYFDAIECVW